MDSRKRALWLLAALCLVTGAAQLTCGGAPYERVWLRVRPSKALGSARVWAEFSAAKGATVREALRAAALAKEEEEEGERKLHLYRLQPVDLGASVEAAGIGWGERLYLTDENLME